VAWLILECAFREQEDGQATLSRPLPFSSTRDDMMYAVLQNRVLIHTFTRSHYP
jgi:hypothetical protein